MLTPYDKRNMVYERALAALTEGDHYYLLHCETDNPFDFESAISAWKDGMAHLDIVLGPGILSVSDPREIGA